ncbi:AI-2E family transporter [Sphingobacterium faecium]|nr:AI-2E family transporter [Sphingobacterium faecium]
MSDIYKKSAAVCIVVLLFLMLTALFIKGTTLLLLLFGGILFSILFHAISSKIQHWTGLNSKICLLLAILWVIIFSSTISYFIGNTAVKQYKELAATVPKMIDNLQIYLSSTNWGTYLIDNIDSAEDQMNKVIQHLPQVFSGTFGFFGDVYAFLFLGIFIMISPKEYMIGIISLFPDKNKRTVEEVLDKVGEQLKIWLKVQLLDMLFVFVLTAIALLILGIELWLILALIAGLLSFIPNLGPTLALIPASLVGLLDGPVTALYIIAIFIGVQIIESAVFAPFVQKKMLSLPPAMVLFFQLLMGTLTGALGLLFATPILVALVNFVNEIYVIRVLRQETAGEMIEEIENDNEDLEYD